MPFACSSIVCLLYYIIYYIDIFLENRTLNLLFWGAYSESIIYNNIILFEYEVSTLNLRLIILVQYYQNKTISQTADNGVIGENAR